VSSGFGAELIPWKKEEPAAGRARRDPHHGRFASCDELSVRPGQEDLADAATPIVTGA